MYTYSLKGGQKNVSMSQAILKTKKGKLSGYSGLKIWELAVQVTHLSFVCLRVKHLLTGFSQLSQLTVSFVNHSLDHHGEHSSVKVKVQLRGNGHTRLGAEKSYLNVIEILLVADTYILFLPLAEVNLEWRHGELLAHPPLVMNSFRDQRWILRAVPAQWTWQRDVVEEHKGKAILVHVRFRFSLAFKHELKWHNFSDKTAVEKHATLKAELDQTFAHLIHKCTNEMCFREKCSVLLGVGVGGVILSWQQKNPPDINQFGKPNRNCHPSKNNFTVNYYLISFLQDLTAVSMVTGGCEGATASILVFVLSGLNLSFHNTIWSLWHSVFTVKLQLCRLDCIHTVCFSVFYIIYSLNFLYPHF